MKSYEKKSQPDLKVDQKMQIDFDSNFTSGDTLKKQISKYKGIGQSSNVLTIKEIANGQSENNQFLKEKTKGDPMMDQTFHHDKFQAIPKQDNIIDQNQLYSLKRKRNSAIGQDQNLIENLTTRNNKVFGTKYSHLINTQQSNNENESGVSTLKTKGINSGKWLNRKSSIEDKMKDLPKSIRNQGKKINVLNSVYQSGPNRKAKLSVISFGDNTIFSGSDRFANKKRLDTMSVSKELVLNYNMRSMNEQLISQRIFKNRISQYSSKLNGLKSSLRKNSKQLSNERTTVDIYDSRKRQNLNIDTDLELKESQVSQRDSKIPKIFAPQSDPALNFESSKALQAKQNQSPSSIRDKSNLTQERVQHLPSITTQRMFKDIENRDEPNAGAKEIEANFNRTAYEFKPSQRLTINSTKKTIACPTVLDDERTKSKEYSIIKFFESKQKTAIQMKSPSLSPRLESTQQNNHIQSVGNSTFQNDYFKDNQQKSNKHVNYAQILEQQQMEGEQNQNTQGNCTFYNKQFQKLNSTTAVSSFTPRTNFPQMKIQQAICTLQDSKDLIKNYNPVVQKSPRTNKSKVVHSQIDQQEIYSKDIKKSYKKRIYANNIKNKPDKTPRRVKIPGLSGNSPHIKSSETIDYQKYNMNKYNQNYQSQSPIKELTKSASKKNDSIERITNGGSTTKTKDADERDSMTPNQRRIHKLVQQAINLYTQQYGEDHYEIQRLERDYKAKIIQYIELSVKVKQLSEQRSKAIKEKFAEEYQENHVPIDNPREHKEYYLLDEDPDKVIELLDNLIYFKEKQVEKGLRQKEDQRPIFINKVLKTEQNKHMASNARLNRNTRFIQQQPHQICKLVKIASTFLYNIYSEDDKYIIDKDEKQRLSIKNKDESNLKKCTEHAHDVNKREKRAKMLQMRAEFEQDLKDEKNLKVSLSKKLFNLLIAIQNSEQFQTSKLKKRMINHQSNLSIENSIEIIKDVNPSILIKNKDFNSDNENEEDSQKSKEILTNQGKRKSIRDNTPVKTYLNQNKINTQPSDILKNSFPNFDSICENLNQKMSQKQILEERGYISIYEDFPNYMRMLSENVITNDPPEKPFIPTLQENQSGGDNNQELLVSQEDNNDENQGNFIDQEQKEEIVNEIINLNQDTKIESPDQMEDLILKILNSCRSGLEAVQI